MPRLFQIIIGLYLAGIVFVHAFPTGAGVSLSRVDVVSFRASDLVHVFVFLPWGLLGAFFVHRHSTGRIGRGVLWTIAGLIVAAGAEGIQYWLPYRSFSWSDMAYNMSGVILGAFVMLIPWSHRGRRKRTSDRHGVSVFR